MTLAVHQQLFTIHSFSPKHLIAPEVFQQTMYFIGKTKEELSVVVPSELELDSLEQERDWRCIEVVGPLGFTMTGIMSRVSGVLANENVSIFAVSTFDTDYILVKKDKLQQAITSLKKCGYQINEYLD